MVAQDETGLSWLLVFLAKDVQRRNMGGSGRVAVTADVAENTWYKCCDDFWWRCTAVVRWWLYSGRLRGLNVGEIVFQNRTT